MAPAKDRFSIKRRAALKSMGLGAAASALSAPIAAQQPPSPFQHGVASGDPLSDRVILWTRVTPLSSQAKAPIPVAWEIADILSPEVPVASGAIDAAPDKDYTVKVDATGLKPNTRYIYRFRVGDVSSPIGRTRTLPVGDVDLMTLAVCSCSNYPYGFFNVYKEMASNPDIDLVLHLGDYIYEYQQGFYTAPEIETGGRVVDPAGEIISLQDYRKRYARYRTDPDLQAVHAAHPFLLIWDDHEFTNDAWTGGAQNHQPSSEGPWKERRAAALKAYEEWMPTRADMRRPWRSFDFGNLARIIMLDTRCWGRDKQLNYATDFEPRTIPFDVTDPKAPKPMLTPNGRATAAAEKIERLAVPFDFRQSPPKPVMDFETMSSFDPGTAPEYLDYLPDVDGFKERLESPSRTLLGQEQEAWLGPQLESSKKRGQTWQVLGQQVIMGRILIPDEAASFVEGKTGYIADQIRGLSRLAPYGLPTNMDAWDGYPAARARLFQQLRRYAKNAVVVAGDSHNGWVSQLGDAKGKVGYEFAAPSVSSPGFEEFIDVPMERVEQAFVDASEGLKWVDAQHRGYVTLSFTQERVEAEYHRVSTVKSRVYNVLPSQRFTVSAGRSPDQATLDDFG